MLMVCGLLWVPYGIVNDRWTYPSPKVCVWMLYLVWLLLNVPDFTRCVHEVILKYCGLVAFHLLLLDFPNTCTYGAVLARC